MLPDPSYRKKNGLFLPGTLLWSRELLPLPQLPRSFVSGGFESVVSHAETLGSVVCLASQWFFPAYRPINVGPAGPPATSLVSAPPTSWGECFFNSLVVGLPRSFGYFLFLSLLSSFWLYEEVKRFYLCLYRGRNSWAAFSKSLAYEYRRRSRSFHCLDSVLWNTKLLIFYEGWFLSFFLFGCYALVSHLRNHCLIQGHEDLYLCYFLSSFIVFTLTFGFKTEFNLTIN